MKYVYTAVNSKSRKYKGEMNGGSRDEIRKNLQARGLTALSIDEFREAAELNANKSIWERDLNTRDIHKMKIKKKKLLALMHQMGLMIKAGITLSLAMEVLIDTEKDKNVRSILAEINKELYNGVPLSGSMAKFRAFHATVINIVRAGEANGRLDMSFEQCALILQKEIALSGKIKSAMGYPVFLLGLTIVLVLILSVLVIPTFKNLFASFDSELPVITQFIMGVSDVIINYWYIITAVVLALVFGFRALKKYNESFAMRWSQIQLKIPLLGTVIRLTHISRFCRMMATLSDAGVSILRSLELSRDVIPNLYMKDCMNQIIEDVKIGTPINVSMSRYPVFDSMLVSMVRVGEESGMLADSLKKMADMYEQQVDESTKRLTDAMTPAMTILIGVVVGTVVISIVVPMFSMYDIVASSGN